MQRCDSAPRSALPPPRGAYPVQAFGEAAFGLEGGGLGGDLAVEQAAGYGDQGERGVGGEFGVAGWSGLNGLSGPCGRSGPRKRRRALLGSGSMGSIWSILSMG